MADTEDDPDFDADTELRNSITEGHLAERAKRLKAIEDRGGEFDSNGRFWTVPGDPRTYDEDGNPM